MEKKNSMLLTVIAVATLLVAVVGATFAYYTISTVDTNNTATFTGKAAKVGTVTMTRETENMHIAVNAADMSSSKINTVYYSVVGSYTPASAGQPFAASRGLAPAVEHSLFTATASNGESDALYDCNFTLTATKSGTMVSSLTAGDVKLILGGASTVNTNVTVNGTYDLVSDFSGNTLTKTVYFHGISGSTAQTLTGHLELKNTALDQKNLADKTLSVVLSATGLTCEQVNAHATQVEIETAGDEPGTDAGEPATPEDEFVAQFNAAKSAAALAVADGSPIVQEDNGTKCIDLVDLNGNYGFTNTQFGGGYVVTYNDTTYSVKMYDNGLFTDSEYSTLNASQVCSEEAGCGWTDQGEYTCHYLLTGEYPE